MIRAILLNSLRNRGGDYKNLIIFAFGLILLAALAYEPHKGNAWVVSAFCHAFLVALAGGGILGGEILSGSLAMVFVRPVPRSTYVLCKWGALNVIGAGIVAGKYLLAVAWLVLTNQLRADWDWISPVLMLQEVLLVAGVAAVVILCDVLRPRGGLYFLSISTAWGLLLIADRYRWGWLKQVYDVWEQIMVPRVQLRDLVGGSGIEMVHLAMLVLCTAGSLYAAIWRIKRIELTHSPE